MFRILEQSAVSDADSLVELDQGPTHFLGDLRVLGGGCSRSGVQHSLCRQEVPGDIAG